MGHVKVYCAVSIDGFIAGPQDDLSWLEQPHPKHSTDPSTISFAQFMEHTGAILMGRRTFDVVSGMTEDWPYGNTTVLVATTRSLHNAPTTVSACRGDIRQLCQRARTLAGEKNVYLDGGNIISQALDAGCIDEMVLTVMPVLLGQGVRLYQGRSIQRFNAEYLGKLGNMMQMRLRIKYYGI